MSVCWQIGAVGFVAKGTGPCAEGYVEYSGPIEYGPDGDSLAMVWDAALNAPRPYTASEAVAYAKVAKLAQIDAEYAATVAGIYDQEAINDVAMGLPTESYAAAVKAHRAELRVAQNAARAAVGAAADIAAVNAVAIQWGSLTPIDPDAPEYQQ